MDEQIEIKQIGDINLRVYTPPGDGPYPVILLLHGWTGDENSMWIFSPHLPPGHVLIAPRGLYPSPLGGYSWHPFQNKAWPNVEDFYPAIETINQILDDVYFNNADFSRLSVVGFSQGAALAYTYLIKHPPIFVKFAGLSGFLPEGIEDILSGRPLEGKQGYVTHGTQDNLVPIARARRSVELLESAGAQITYCEGDVGHKLSIECFRGMETFFVG